MPDTIRILAKKAFRFNKPGVDPMTALKVDENKAEFEESYFVAVPGEVVEAPAWIKQDPFFDQLVKLEELAVVQPSGHSHKTPEKAVEEKPQQRSK